MREYRVDQVRLQTHDKDGHMHMHMSIRIIIAVECFVTVSASLRIY